VPPSPKSDAKKITPVMRQYEDAKSAYPDAVLFFRMGDFYEMFHDDAVLVAKELSLTLTARNKGAPDEIPMAGVPHHAAHGYVAKLLAKGYKVAICDQMADPSKVKGIVPRQVVRVVTPGLVTETDQLDARANNYLAAVDATSAAPGSPFGLALLDLSTGELAAAVVPDLASLLAELGRADPREVLVPAGFDDVAALARTAAPRAALRADEPLAEADVATTIDAAAAPPLAAETAQAHAVPAVRAVARALRFAKRCTPGAALPVRRVSPLDPSATLRLDETAQAHLEICRGVDGSTKGSLLDVVDATVTPGGARLLRRRLLSPLLDVGAIRRRHDEVEVFVTHPRARGELRAALAGVGDLERLAVRAALREATPRDLAAIRDGLLVAPGALAALMSLPDPSARELLGVDGVDLVPELATVLSAAIVDRPPPHAREGGVIRDGFDRELDEQRHIKRSATELVLALEAELRAQTGATSLRVRYTRVFGWYIEVTKTHLAKAPSSWRRKQTVAGGERFTNDALDDLADKIENAESRATDREAELVSDLAARASSAADRVRRLAAQLAAWDVAAALADVAHRHDYVRPHVDAGDVLAISDGRHPVVERLAAAGRFVPNDTTLDLEAEHLWLVTGPNMAGKSTLMRQVALIVVLAQAGSYVPAREARIGVVDRILSRVGASDDVARGESTFMVEMRETATILREATRRSLVILDEIGRGTSTYDGLAIAWAVAEHLHEAVGCRALFATHYHELTELAKTARGVANYSVSAREHGEDVVFLHKLSPGAASRSYGVAVAKLAGIPEGVVARAKAILGTLETGAALPSGQPSTLRRRSRAGSPQLDLFAAPATHEDEGAKAAVDTLRVVDVDRLTPLDALALVAKLRALVTPRA
jgi:DNA mismatch repair protein MutS